MAYKIREAAEGVSTGGSLISDAKLKQLYTTMLQCRLLTERARRAHHRNGSASPLRGFCGAGSHRYRLRHRSAAGGHHRLPRIDHQPDHRRVGQARSVERDALLSSMRPAYPPPLPKRSSAPLPAWP